MKRVMVDMSATLIHHGHVRLLEQASRYGHVVVALTTDDEVLRTKGYLPELSYDERREVLLAIRYVSEVVPSPWMIEESLLDEHRIDLLIHGADNRNLISSRRLLILPRTEGVSSTELRQRARDVLEQRRI